MWTLLLLPACGLTEYDPAPIDGTDQPGRFDPPVLEDVAYYRNPDTVLITGLGGPSDLLVTVTVDSSAGAESQDVAVLDGVFEVELTVPRGEEVSISATNDQGSSNVVTTWACDPYDAYEIEPVMPDTWGDTCGEPIEPFAALRDSDNDGVVFGNVLTEGDEDWYVVTMVDEEVTENSAGLEKFRASVVMDQGVGNYVFEVYRGSCDAPECGELGGYEEYDWYRWDTTPDDDGNVPADPRACGPEPLDPCEDYSAPYYVRVTRTDGELDCTPYSLTISNGHWE